MKKKQRIRVVSTHCNRLFFGYHGRCFVFRFMEDAHYIMVSWALIVEICQLSTWKKTSVCVAPLIMRIPSYTIPSWNHSFLPFKQPCLKGDTLSKAIIFGNLAMLRFRACTCVWNDVTEAKEADEERATWVLQDESMSRCFYVFGDPKRTLFFFLLKALVIKEWQNVKLTICKLSLLFFVELGSGWKPFKREVRM